MGVAEDSGSFPQPELDKTDELPVLDVAAFEASHIEPVDSPALTESIRSVEEKIARQQAQHESLQRDLDRARAAESAAEKRADTLLGELGSIRKRLESERERAEQRDKTLEERSRAAHQAITRSEQSEREAERLRAEANILRETLLARDTSLAHALHSLGERDSQHAALERSHAALTQSLDQRTQHVAQLEAQLHQSDNQLDSARQAAVQAQTASAALKRAEHRLASLHAQVAEYHERLCSREYQRGTYENSLRALDSEIAAQSALAAELRTDRDTQARTLAEHNKTLADLQQQLDANTSNLSDKSSAFASLELSARETQTEFAAHRTATSEQITALEQEKSLLTATIAALQDSGKENERLRADLEARVSSLLATQEMQSSRLSDQLQRLEQELVTAHQSVQTHMLAAQSAETEVHTRDQRLQESVSELSALQASHLYHEQTLAKMRSDIATMSELLDEARRPTRSVEAELNRVAAELAAKSAKFDEMYADHRGLRKQYELTKAALEEREFKIRRLERTAANSAKALARIQHSVERLGERDELKDPAAVQSRVATLARMNGNDDSDAIALGPRTRVGRAPDSDLRVDASSVSRHHALIVCGAGSVTVEDLNSTNGIWINDNKTLRGKLVDGDILSIGAVRFRFAIAPAQDSPH